MCAQGDFYHWVPLFNYFDELLETHVAPRKDLQLAVDGDMAEEPFPAASILAILKVSATIMENCSNKHLYHSYEVSDLLRPTACIACTAFVPAMLCAPVTWPHFPRHYKQPAMHRMSAVRLPFHAGLQCCVRST